MVSIHRPLGYGPSTLPLRHSAATAGCWQHTVVVCSGVYSGVVFNIYISIVYTHCVWSATILFGHLEWVRSVPENLSERNRAEENGVKQKNQKQLHLFVF